MTTNKPQSRHGTPLTNDEHPIGLWILPDQLLPPDSHAGIVHAIYAAGGEKGHVRIVIVESRKHLTALPYHRKRLVLELSAGRHYAEELARAGFEVEVTAADRFIDGLRAHRKRHGWKRLVAMRAVEHPTASLQDRLAARPGEFALDLIPNRQFLWPETEFAKLRAKNVVMENFYRTMRRQFRLLIDDDGSPVGGRWNFDADNRKPLPRNFVPPAIPQFVPDGLTRAVMAEVDASFPQSVGSSEGFAMPVTRLDAETAFSDFLENRLSNFGPYEDAMSRTNGTLWHSQLSPVMNLGLLDSLQMCQAAEKAYHDEKAPLNSVEGFIRQVIGWREYVHWQYVRQSPGLRQANSWAHHRPTPQFWWDGRTDMACLRIVIDRLRETAMNHHIERLMLLCNFAMLAGIDPEAVADWFLTWYADSHDWVVLPNVVGMGLNADGGKTATKPYIASAAYVNKMSDFCSGCHFDPKKRTGENACPFNTLYWNFLITHEAKLRSNPRMGPNVLGLRHLRAEEREIISREAHEFLEKLAPYDDPGYAPDTDCD